MAKGNMLLGYSRGSVGDVVFTRSKGQQIARARNRNPKNPKTKAQMSQRIKFASVVEFFRRGNQNLFQFAFENKGAKQSDYNAFVSANADKGIYLTPEQLKDPKFPIVAPFIMTQGSLSRKFTTQSQGIVCFAVEGTEQTPIATVKQVSELLVAQGYENGDIITVVKLGGVADPTGEPYSKGIDAGPWYIGQFTVDTENTSSMDDANIEVVFDDELELIVFGPKNVVSSYAGCGIVSHVYPEGLKVTNSQIVLATAAETCYTAALAPAWVEKCIDIWGASEEAILQGSLS